MTPTKLLVGQILIVFAIMVLGVWASTQWAASMLGYQAQFGTAWFQLAGLLVDLAWDIGGDGESLTDAFAVCAFQYGALMRG